MKAKFRKYPLLIFIVLMVYIAAGLFADDIWTRHIQVNGIVEGVAYDPKGRPTVRIGGEDYHLTSHRWIFPVKIAVGDKIIKRRGEIRLLLIKFNGKDTIDLTKPYNKGK